MRFGIDGVASPLLSNSGGDTGCCLKVVGTEVECELYSVRYLRCMRMLHRSLNITSALPNYPVFQISFGKGTAKTVRNPAEHF